VRHERAALALAVVIASTKVYAQPVALALRASTDGVSLAPHCAFVRDRDASLRAQAVFEHAVALQPVAPGGVNEGFTRAVLWLRCTLINTTPAPNTWFVDLGNQVDEIEVYTRAEGRLTRTLGGRTTGVFVGEVPYLTTLSQVTLGPGGEAVLVLRLRSAAPLVLRPRVWSAARLPAHGLTQALAMGLFYGMLLVAAAYNAVLYGSTRVRVYRSYALYIASVTAFAAVSDRLVAAYLTPHDATWLATSGVRFGAVAILASLFFERDYLDTPRLMPRTEVLVRPVCVALVLLFASTFVSNAVAFKQLGVAAGVCALVGAFAAAIVALKRGSVEAPWFLVAISATMLGFFVRGAVSVGVLPLNAATDHAWRAGIVVDVAVLAVGLAARVRVLREAHARVRAKLLADRESMNAELEALVGERTRALEETQRALSEAQREVSHQKRMASLGQLASALAHEVANPLNFTVGGAAELARHVTALRTLLLRAKTEGEAFGEAHKALDGVQRALDLVQGGNARIRAVVESLRAYTRSGAIEVEAVDVLEAAHTTLRLVDSKLRAQGVTVTVHGTVLPKVRGRVGELCQVFMNLVLNAAQAMPDGGTIDVVGAVVGDHVEVTVSDNGPGIAAERRSAVFDPYFTTREADGGTGLGLSVSHEIMRQLGGSLRLATTEGPGATFVLSLRIWGGNATSDAC
jgi:signal transduction histidine kinase